MSPSNNCICANDPNQGMVEGCPQHDPPAVPTRKASDVILSIERRFDVLLQTATNSDNNTKLLLGRMNRICSLLESIDTQLKLGNGAEPEPEIDHLSYLPEIEVETSPKGYRRTARPETYSDEKSARVIPTQQKIFDPSGKSVYMAEVEIFNAADRSLVTKLRSTAGGKWQLPLAPGDYIVTILKRPNGTRNKMTYSNNFSVKETDGPIELESAKLELEK